MVLYNVRSIIDHFLTYKFKRFNRWVKVDKCKIVDFNNLVDLPDAAGSLNTILIKLSP